MPTETQELQLRITLDDQASAGLARLREDLKQLTEGSGKNALDKFKAGQEDLSKHLREISKVALGGERSLIGYIGKIGAIGAAAGTIVGTVIAGQRSLKEFADQIIQLSNKAKVIGMDPAELKSLVQQYERLGVQAGVVEQSMAGFTETIAEVNRIGSQKRMEMIQAAGAWGQVMQQGIDRVNAQATRAEKLNEVLIQAQNVYDNRLKETHGNVEDATKAANDFVKMWGLDPSMRVLANVKKITEEDKKRMEAQEKATKDYHKAVSDLGKEWEEFSDDIKNSLLSADGWVVSGLKMMVTLVKEMRELWNQPWTGPGSAAAGAAGAEVEQWTGQKPPVASPAATPHGAPHAAAPTPAAPSPAAPASTASKIDVMNTPFYFGGGGGAGGEWHPSAKALKWLEDADLPMSQNIEDRRNEVMRQGFADMGGDEYGKKLDENTEQLKKLNENFKLLDQGEVQLKGLGGLPGFRGGGGGGFGAPYGSSVGPGSGAGAGTTDSGAGTQDRTDDDRAKQSPDPEKTTTPTSQPATEAEQWKAAISPAAGQVSERLPDYSKPQKPNEPSTTPTRSGVPNKDTNGNIINSDVFKQAEAIAANPNKTRLQREEDAKAFIRAHGGHVDSAWCGNFVTAVQRGMGHKGSELPSNPQIATSWMKYGTAVKPGEEQPGDIAIITRGHAAGQPGGHVMMVGSKGRDPKTGRVQTFGANYANERMMGEAGLVFRRPPKLEGDRQTVDASAGAKGVRTVKVQQGGTLTADVSAPANAKVEVKGGGAFNKTETTRTMPLSDKPAAPVTTTKSSNGGGGATAEAGPG